MRCLKVNSPTSSVSASSEQRQFGAGEKGAHGADVDLGLVHGLRVAQVGTHPPVHVEDVDVDGRVDRHEHFEQRVERAAVERIARGFRDLGPMLDDVAGKAVRQALQRLLFVRQRDAVGEEGDEQTAPRQQDREGERDAEVEGCPHRCSSRVRRR